MRTIRVIPFFAAAVLCTGVCSSQDLTPRFYWPSPEGTKVAVFGYTYSTGDVLMDPSLPLYGVDSRIHTGFLGYLQTFSLAGRTANVILELPYSWGSTSGEIVDEPARRDYSGFNDFGLTLAINLLGAPTMDLTGFQALRDDPHPILGASLKILAPTGAYNSNRLINAGANRWAAKLEFGSVFPLGGRWLLEIELGAWTFGDDPDFITGKRVQEGIIAGEIHIVHRFKPGFWASLEVNYFAGGRQTIDGNELIDLQRNSRVGATIVIPWRGRHAFKIGYSRGVVTSYGNDFDQFLASYLLSF